MAEQPAAERTETRPQAADAVLALAVIGVRTGLPAGGAVARVVAPAPRPENWPSRRLRLLAETGFRQRQAALASAERLYRKVVPVVVADVLDLLDLPALARGMDLPTIIRESTGSLAAESVHDVRLQAGQADEAVGRWFDRVLRR
ncbi:MAG: hypothetical protein GEV28_20235 [Actinophytocola sp.]|uniref:hypothetical protein n=1 Tax=Actinophytocola sp. TaxID=1872138 RepID=UPI001329B685|nr:hypothetical protein [Actinophytocola sp.]MPZ82597.1 hypothetical protein [Actinophytocola sp.]